MCDWHRYVQERLSVPGLKKSRERDVIAEVASQLEDTYQEAMAKGMRNDEAKTKAEAHVPDWDAFARELVKAERSRRRARGDQWAEGASEALSGKGGRWAALADLIQDLRYSIRSLRLSPGFSSVALLTLALGIGGVATIFTLFDQVLLRPLPYHDSDDLMVMWERLPGYANASVSYPNFLDWKSRNRVYEEVAAFNTGSMNVTGSGDPVEINTVRVSASGFDILGISPALGRGFLPEEDRVGAEGVAVLAYNFWRDRFGEDPDVVGSTLLFDELPFTVVGVMPEGFVFPISGTDADVFVPIEQFAENWLQNRGNHPGIWVIGRLLPGQSPETAVVEMDRVAIEMVSEYPELEEGTGVNLTTLKERITSRAGDSLMLLLLAVGFLLLIACINVANLVLARSTSREQEMAVRVSMGAGQQRILRLLLTESIVLWTSGGVLGVLLAIFGVRGITTLMADQLPPMVRVALDVRVVVMVMGISLLTGLIFGLPSALRIVRKDLREFLKEGVRATGGLGRSRFRNGLVVAEVSLAVALLTGAGLTLRSSARIAKTSPGLDPEKVLAVEVNLPDGRYSEPVTRAAFFSQLLDQTREMPGVVSAATSYNVPLGPGGWQNGYYVEGQPPEVGAAATFAETNAVSTGYFRTMGIPILAGREFTRLDNPEAPPVIIVGEGMAERYWPGDDPLGKRVKWGGFESDNQWMEVVGVVGHVKVNGVLNDTDPQIYVPHWQDADTGYFLMVKTRGEPLSLAEPIRQAVLALDPAQPLASVGTMEAYAGETTRGPELLALLMGIFSAAAVLLAAVGIYGVMAQMTAERRHEIGIRMALGAQDQQVLGLVFRQGLVTVVLGVIIGLGLAYGVGKLMTAQLYEISATDPLTFVLTPLLVAGVALAANLLPARRATKVDPVRALQAE